MQLLFVASVAILIAIVTFTKGPHFWDQSLIFYMTAAAAIALIVIYRTKRSTKLSDDLAVWLMLCIPALACVMALVHFHVTTVGSMALGLLALLGGWAAIGVLQHFKVIH